MRGLRKQRLHNTRCWADAFVRHFPGGRKPWELSAENRRELGYDFVVPAACAALNATAVKPPKVKTSAGRRARRAARLSKNSARRRKPSVRKEERVPKWVHVVEE